MRNDWWAGVGCIVKRWGAWSEPFVHYVLVAYTVWYSKTIRCVHSRLLVLFWSIYGIFVTAWKCCVALGLGPSSVSMVLDCVWNVMAHAQKTDLVFRRNGRVHLTLNIPSLGRQRCLPSWGPRRTPWFFFCNLSTVWCGRLLKLCFLGFWNYNSAIQALLVSNILCLFISTEVSQ